MNSYGPTGDETQPLLTEINRDQFKRVSGVRPTEHSISVAIFLITNHMNTVPKHLHDVCRGDVPDREFLFVEFNVVVARIEPSPVDHRSHSTWRRGQQTGYSAWAWQRPWPTRLIQPFARMRERWTR